jgi:hypothetical protein
MVELIPAMVVVLVVLVVPQSLVLIVTVPAVVVPVDILVTAELVEAVVPGVPGLVIVEPAAAADQVVIMAVVAVAVGAV